MENKVQGSKEMAVQGPDRTSDLQGLGRSWGPLEFQGKHAHSEGQVVVLWTLTQHCQQESCLGQCVCSHPGLTACRYLILLALMREAQGGRQMSLAHLSGGRRRLSPGGVGEGWGDCGGKGEGSLSPWQGAALP